MTSEKRFFNLAAWLVRAAVLLAMLTSCNPYEGLQPATGTPAATATRQLSQVATSLPSPTPQACIVSTGIDAGNLNLRSGAGIDHSVIQTLAEGQRLNITDKPAKGPWIKVTTPAGVIGWVNSIYCKGV